MAFKIFYAWQSDRPNNLNRGLIRKALDDALKNLTTMPEIEEVVRGAEVDQDTQGLPGSPSIADAIFEKIRGCDVFIADLTMSTPEDAERPAPNPNVLVEYGYALHALGAGRVIIVFNEAFGKVEDLPFDIKHRRCMTYDVSDDSPSDSSMEARRKSRGILSRALLAALKAVATTLAEDIEEKDSVVEPGGEPMEGAVLSVSDDDEIRLGFGSDLGSKYRGSIPYPWHQGTLGIRLYPSNGDEVQQVLVPDQPHLFLRLEPRGPSLQLSNAEAIRLARNGLKPFVGARPAEYSFARNGEGPVVFETNKETPEGAVTATQLFRRGELWGVNFSLLDPTRRGGDGRASYIPTTAVEEVLIDTLISYTRFANDKLKLSLPVEITAGLVGIDGYRLAVDPQFFHMDKFVGHIFQNGVADEFLLDSFDFDPFEKLRPLFEKIYDAAAEIRPDVRSVGRLQR